MLRKIVGWPVAWALYWMGHAASRWGGIYGLYNWLMLRSLDVNDWAGLTLWKDANASKE